MYIVWYIHMIPWYIKCVLYIHTLKIHVYILQWPCFLLPPFTTKDTNDSRQGHAAMQLFAAMQQPPELNAESGAPGVLPSQSLTWNLKMMVSKFGISYSRVPFSGSMLNLGRVCWDSRNLAVFFREEEFITELSLEIWFGRDSKVAANMGGGFKCFLFLPGSLGK